MAGDDWDERDLQEADRLYDEDQAKAGNAGDEEAAAPGGDQGDDFFDQLFKGSTGAYRAGPCPRLWHLARRNSTSIVSPIFRIGIGVLSAWRRAAAKTPTTPRQQGECAPASRP